MLPVAATEQHGPHLPVSTDTAISKGLVSRLADRLPKASGAVFLPTQAVGKSNEHLRYPGTLTHTAQTLIAMWTEIGASVARAGVRKMVFLNSHGGNVNCMDIVVRELRVRHSMLAFSVNWFSLGMPDGLYDNTEMRHGIHAGDMETSVMLALDPDNVDMDEATNFKPASMGLDQQYEHISLSGGAKPGWQAQDLHPQGACGNAAAATREKGEATLEHATTRLLDLLAEIERLPLEWLDNEPDW